MTDEDKLRRAFRALKNEDTRKVPSFGDILERPAPRRSRLAFIVPAASVAAAAAAVLVVWSTSSSPQPAATASHRYDAVAGAAAAAPAVSDPAPLDFLLDLPGSSALAATVPFAANDAKVFR